MADSDYSLTVYIAVRGCPMVRDDESAADPSSVGHMWISLDDNTTGLKESYGFHPTKEGMPIWSGEVRTDDLHAYTQIYYQKSFPITKDTHDNLHDYCQIARKCHTFGFYSGIGNACVDFAWDVMHAAGIPIPALMYVFPVVKDWPTWNASLVDIAYANYME
ncbi:hypothetical protein Ga0466249_002414 [Sporomusaceae bacterium BoRhaA]|uniref:hypothetical protein n=1 Tax=Pelorhabdus rhamnosifermentans TaxID=2772457 RepID=UPI001C06419B|nr:hypothetical protein [Pelorhabdus rhamnosifermentans]MBU2701300.1 hypothetical protein [Pelorhabdus rhamnosifermentans]